MEKVTGLKKLNQNDFIALIYKDYGRKLFSYSINTWKVSDDIAWDLVYKTIWRMAEVYKNYSFETDEKFASFLFKIFINYLRNYYRDNREQRETIFYSTANADIPEGEKENEALTENIKLKALNEVLENMEDWQRLLLLLRSEGRPYAEIAVYVDKPEKQLKVYYKRLKELITLKLNDRFK